MNRIKEITIICQNGWSETYLFTQLEETKEHNLFLDVFTPRESYQIQLTDSESYFIAEMKKIGIEKIDNRFYNAATEDCDSWNLRICYDDKEIVSAGYYEVPHEVISLLRFIGYDYKKGGYSMKKNPHYVQMNDEQRNFGIGVVRAIDRAKRMIHDDRILDNCKYLTFESDDKGQYKIGFRMNPKTVY